MSEKIGIRPLGDRIVLQREKSPEKIGLIIVPDSAKEKPLQAVVLATGPGALFEGRRIEPSVKKGDRVLVQKYAGTEVTINGAECFVVREDDIVGVIE